MQKKSSRKISALDRQVGSGLQGMQERWRQNTEADARAERQDARNDSAADRGSAAGKAAAAAAARSAKKKKG